MCVNNSHYSLWKSIFIQLEYFQLEYVITFHKYKIFYIKTTLKIETLKINIK